MKQFSKPTSISGFAITRHFFADNLIETNESNYISGANTGQLQQPATVEKADEDDLILVFFAVGIVVNIALVTTYFVWAYRQWKKKLRETSD